MSTTQISPRETKFRIWKGLLALAKAGETDDAHIEHESYIEAMWRFRSALPEKAHHDEE